MASLIVETVKPAFRWGIVPVISFSAHRTRHTTFREPALKDMLAYWLPQSEWCITPASGFLRNHIIVKACATTSAVIRGSSEQPTNHFTFKQIEHDGRIYPDFVSP